ncbi:MAG: ABC transporter substrate-binding protein [Clostridia bacterium]|nr:ABC transporter substrate-binding protein [Clostridia bacterium]
MRRLIAMLAAGILLFSGISACAQAPALTYPDRDYEELVVGNPTRMDGKFFTGMWGNATTDIDVRTLVHAYYLVEWGYDSGFLRANPVVASAQGVFEDSKGIRIYRFQLADDLYYSDGTEITAWDYAFSVLFQAAPEIAELGGRPMDLSYLEGYEEYISGEVSYLSGVRVTDDRMIEFRVKPEALPYFFEMYRMGFLPYPIHEIAPGCKVYDDGQGIYIGNEDPDVKEKIFCTELLEATVMDPENGYLSHPTVGSGPYVLTSWDGETCTFEINPYFKGNAEGFKPTIPKLRFTLAKDEDMIEKLEADEFQLLNKVVRRDTITKGIELVSSGKGYTLTNYPRIGLSFIVFTPDRPAVQEKNVRQAIAYCMDKKALQNEYTYLYGIPVDGMLGIGQWMYGMVKGTEDYPETLPDDPTPDEEEAYDARIEQWESLSLDGVKHYELDVERASRLLDAVGWTMNENGQRFAAGRDDVRCKKVQGELLKLDLTLAYPESNEMAEAMEAWFVEPLKQAGIRLTLVPMTMNDLVHAYHDRDIEGIDMFYVADDFNIEFDPQLFFLAGDPDAPKEDTLAWAHAQMSEYARLMLETVPSDALGFVQKWITFQEQLSDLLPLIPVYSNVYYDFYTSDLMNYDIIRYITWGDAIVASSYYNVYQSMVDRGIDPTDTEDDFEILP